MKTSRPFKKKSGDESFPEMVHFYGRPRAGPGFDGLLFITVPGFFVTVTELLSQFLGHAGKL